MNNWWQSISAIVLTASLLTGTQALATEGHGAYEVTVTNITKGEIFTPIMVASHPRGIRLFELGEPARTELAMLAEGGDTEPLSQWLLSEGAHDVVTAGDVLPPGGSVTLTVETRGNNRYISIASMLVPSNDAFFAVNGVRGPRGNRSSTLFARAYDAGSEDNDELCVNIPGPPFICAGEGFNADTGEGYVFIHPGIQGNGDLVAAEHDWNNPVARIRVKFIR